MMKTKTDRLLAEFKSGLNSIYGRRLRGVYLFGSYARDDQDSESDFDVLIVLESFASYAAEVERTGQLSSDLSLKYGVSISSVFVKEFEWIKAETPFLVNVRREGIAA